MVRLRSKWSKNSSSPPTPPLLLLSSSSPFLFYSLVFDPFTRFRVFLADFIDQIWCETIHQWMTSFFQIFKNTRANTHTRSSLCNSRGSRTSGLLICWFLREPEHQLSIITFNFYMNPIEQKAFEVRWGGEGRGSPHSTAHCGPRRTASELRNDNRDRIQYQSQSFKIISTNWRKVQIKSDKNRQIVGQIGEGGSPVCSARASACQHELNQHKINKIEIINLNI